MSFNNLESTNYINIKLTDEGRNQISLGKLKFSKLVFSDREVDYGIDFSYNYNIDSNRILSPIDTHPDIEPFNFDGSSARVLNQNSVTSLKQFITGGTITNGLLSGDSANYSLLNVFKDSTTLTYSSQNWGTNEIIYNGSMSVDTGDLIFVGWIPVQSSSNILDSSPYSISGVPLNGLWYGVLSADSGSSSITLDRPIPDFTSTSQDVGVFSYPFNGIQNFYGSGLTQSTNAWNINIVRTYDVAGTNVGIEGISGFTQYGSLEYSGTKTYFGFSSDTPTFGIIHYTNEYTGNTHGEQFIEGTAQLEMPTLMWHKITGYTNSNASIMGHTFYDAYGKSIYDPVARTTYKNLRDGISSGDTIVGRVYHKLKLFIITDQEILNALSYKSNRSYTFPEPIVELTSHSNSNTPYYSVSGLCESGKTYFVTLAFENSVYGASTSFGYQSSVHSGYIKKIQGENDVNGRPKFLKISFPANSFPYMRSDTNISSGTGWNSNYVQVLINEQLTDYNYNIGNVPPTGWIRVSSATTGGNGVYKASDYGDSTIDADKLNAYSFVVSRQDYNSGSTYNLYSGLTANQDVLNFGDESLFFGIVKVQTIKTKYITSIVEYILPNEMEDSLNPTFDKFKNDSTYVSEIAVLDSFGKVVAVGKPTHPLEKERHRLLAVQLILEF